MFFGGVFDGILGAMLAGFWGCFADMFVVCWRDLGGKHGLQHKEQNGLINLFEFLMLYVCSIGVCGY